jgi:hypothetical protein
VEEGGGGGLQLVAVDLEAVQREQELDALAPEQSRNLALTAEIEDEKLEKGVYDNSFVAVSNCSKV